MDQVSIAVEEVRVVDREGIVLPWRVWWSALWVGALSALALAVVIGLIAVAIGAYRLPFQGINAWSEFGLGALVFSVSGSFFAFAAGGWIAARIAGLERAESAMLHGAIVWVLAVPLLLALAATGGSAYLGQWYGGLAAAPAWVTPAPVAADAEAAATVARNGALGALAALLLGLAGGVIGGWMASGQPMTLGTRGRANLNGRVETT